MRKGQQISIEILIVMALALMLVGVWFYGQGKANDTIKANLNDSVCIAAVNVASISMGSHTGGEGTAYSWVQKGSIDFEDVCCSTMVDPIKGDEEEILGYLSKQINTTCELGKKLRDVDYFDTDGKEFCYMARLKVEPSEEVWGLNILKLQGNKCITIQEGGNEPSIEADEEANYRLTFAPSTSDSGKTIRNVVYIEKLSQDE